MRQRLHHHLATLIILCFSCLLVNAQTDTSAQRSRTGLSDSVKNLTTRVQAIEEKEKKTTTPIQKPPVNNTDSTATKCTTCGVRDGKLGQRWWLVFMPVILVIFIGGYFMRQLLKGRFDLASVVSTGEFVSRADGKQDTEKPVGSASRLIAFLTGITAFIIAICLVTYYAYYTMAECSGQMPFDDLWKILAGLGIGVIPYGVNVWRGNNKEKDNNPVN